MLKQFVTKNPFASVAKAKVEFQSLSGVSERTIHRRPQKDLRLPAGSISKKPWMPKGAIKPQMISSIFKDSMVEILPSAEH